MANFTYGDVWLQATVAITTFFPAKLPGRANHHVRLSRHRRFQLGVRMCLLELMHVLHFVTNANPPTFAIKAPAKTMEIKENLSFESVTFHPPSMSCSGIVVERTFRSKWSSENEQTLLFYLTLLICGAVDLAPFHAPISTARLVADVPRRAGK